MILLFASIVVIIYGQSCSDGGIGQCVGGLCPDPSQQTCLPSNICCDNGNIVSGAPTTTTPPPPPPVQTCGDGGMGACLGGLCPTGATCITSGTQQICCNNNQIGVTPGPPLGCADNVSANCATVASYCSNAYYYNVMTVQCPVTCNRCGAATLPPAPPPAPSPTTTLAPAPSTQCRDNATVNCASLASYCNNAVYFNLLTQQCPVTCGRCNLLTTPPPVGNCLDLVNPSTGVTNCPSIQSYCNNALYYTLMTQQCPRTCNRCPSTTTCVDLVNPQTGVSDCPSLTQYCNNAVYYTLMTQQCPRTCNRCSSG